MYKLLLAGFLLVCAPALSAQEINARIQVITQEVQQTNKQIFETLEESLREFLNSSKWTNEQYEFEERIDCSFALTIKERSGNRFRGELQVSYSRPVYNSSYRSPMLNYRDDKIDFEYQEGQRIEFVEGRHVSNLTSVLAYYIYVIIGMDHDTFERNSGQDYYEKAQKIVSTAQSDPQATGWKSFDGNKNRYWLVDNLLSPAFRPIIDLYYDYHRQGLDLMHEPSNHKEAKTTMREALMGLKEVHRKRPNAFLTNLLFDAKSEEIKLIFSGGEPVGKVVDLAAFLSEVDAQRADRYQKIGQN